LLCFSKEAHDAEHVCTLFVISISGLSPVWLNASFTLKHQRFANFLFSLENKTTLDPAGLHENDLI
jgi:hypothetical protein